MALHEPVISVFHELHGHVGDGFVFLLVHHCDDEIRFELGLVKTWERSPSVGGLELCGCQISEKKQQHKILLTLSLLNDKLD